MIFMTFWKRTNSNAWSVWLLKIDMAPRLKFWDFKIRYSFGVCDTYRQVSCKCWSLYVSDMNMARILKSPCFIASVYARKFIMYYFHFVLFANTLYKICEFLLSSLFMMLHDVSAVVLNSHYFKLGEWL